MLVTERVSFLLHIELTLFKKSFILIKYFEDWLFVNFALLFNVHVVSIKSLKTLSMLFFFFQPETVSEQTWEKACWHSEYETLSVLYFGK